MQYANFCLCGNYILGKKTHTQFRGSIHRSQHSWYVGLFMEGIIATVFDRLHDTWYAWSISTADVPSMFLCIIYVRERLCPQSTEFYALGCWYCRRIKWLSVISHFYKIKIASLQNHKMNYSVSVFTRTPIWVFFRCQNSQKGGSLPYIFTASPKSVLLPMLSFSLEYQHPFLKTFISTIVGTLVFVCGCISWDTRGRYIPLFWVPRPLVC